MYLRILQSRQVLSTCILLACVSAGCNRRPSADSRQEFRGQENTGLKNMGDTDADSRRRTDAEWMWVALWRSTAAGKGLAPAEVNEIADILTDVLDFGVDKNVNAAYGSDLRSAYELSLRNFIDTQFSADTSKARLGSGYWLAFCVVEAARRLSDSSASVSNPTFDAVLDDICNNMIRPGFKRVLASDDYAAWSDTIEVGLADFKRNMGIVIAQLQRDVLSPGLRRDGPMAEETRNKLVRWFEYPGHIPKYEDPDKILASKNGHYQAQLRKFFAVDALNYCLYQLFFGQNAPAVTKNRYWGNMKWSGISQSVIPTETGLLRWPVRLQMRPNNTLNGIEKWERRNERDPKD